MKLINIYLFLKEQMQLYPKIIKKNLIPKYLVHILN